MPTAETTDLTQLTASLTVPLSERWKKLAGPCSAVAVREGSDCSSFPQAPDRISHSRRRAEWVLARQCEQDLRETLSTCSVGKKVLTSISHSAGVVVGVGAASDGPLRISKIGVDLEREARVMSRRAQERVLFGDEKSLALSPLEIWVIKEACFKACPSSAGTVLSDYRVTQWEPLTGCGSVSLGGENLEFSLLKESGWIVTLALSALS